MSDDEKKISELWRIAVFVGDREAFGREVRKYAAATPSDKQEAVAHVFPVVGSGTADLQGNPGVTISAPPAQSAEQDRIDAELMTDLHKRFAFDLHAEKALGENAFSAARARFGTNTEEQDRMLYQAILAYLAQSAEQDRIDAERYKTALEEIAKNDPYGVSSAGAIARRSLKGASK